MPELSPAVTDALVAAAIAAVGLACGALVLRGYRPWPVIAAMLRRAAGAAVLFVALIATSLSLGLILTAQERGLRQASARAADPFDVVVAAPGSETTAMLATVFLQPADMPLLTGAQIEEIAAAPGVSLAAPLGFGDSVDGAPVVGTTTAFVRHLAGDPVQGRHFAARDEAVVGALAPFALGEVLEPAHGTGAAAAEDHAHDGHGLHVVGRLAPTGGPWDHAVITPIETLWDMHGLADGHPLTDGDRDDAASETDRAPEVRPIGPPWDPALVPGVPAVIIDTDQLAQAYAVRSLLSRPDMMAFFPGTVLSQLHAVLGDARAALSIMALATQALVTIAVLAGLTLVMALFADHFVLLGAMGAPMRFTLAVSWGFAAILILAGAALGLALAWAGMGLASAILTERLGLSVSAAIGWPELHMLAAFVVLMLLAALVPAWQQMRRQGRVGIV